MLVKQGGSVCQHIWHTDRVTDWTTNESKLDSWQGKEILSFPRYPEQLWCQLFMDVRGPFSEGKAARTHKTGYVHIT